MKRRFCANDVWETLLRLLAQLPLVVAARFRSAHGLSPVEYREDLSYTGNLLWSLTDREQTPLAERALDAFLILSAEHELAPSTFVARITASTRSDFLSAVIAGISVIKGIWARRTRAAGHRDSRSRRTTGRCSTDCPGGMEAV